ncbi:hypothetical protein [Kordiimonas lacus]|uniref:Uncharacterized protein n=1 Tax=Kordiimonas lacus TaxID=637679 RepID=A0A1G6ZK18_9PROT|nr:hypothetical protein [Kordiimonas lacus]SDE01906.1 hypothetical protein SAMN04488071_1813 [Kordiimonas lacus]
MGLLLLILASAGAQGLLWFAGPYRRLNPIFRAFAGTLVGSIAGYLMVDQLATDAQDYFAIFYGVAIAFMAAILFELICWARRMAR